MSSPQMYFTRFLRLASYPNCCRQNLDVCCEINNLNNQGLTRRQFLKDTLMGAGGILAGVILARCEGSSYMRNAKRGPAIRERPFNTGWLFGGEATASITDDRIHFLSYLFYNFRFFFRAIVMFSHIDSQIEQLQCTPFSFNFQFPTLSACKWPPIK
jgi:hypothetical protein